MPGQQQQQRWQPWSSATPYYHGAAPSHYSYYTTATAVATPTPLKPADNTNQRFPIRALTPTKPVPVLLPKPVLMERSNSLDNIPMTKPPPMERKPSAPSPESVLDFVELCGADVNIHSWDEEGDVVSLGSVEPAVLAIDDDALHLPLLSPQRCTMDHMPACLSPPRLEFRKDSHPSFIDTLQTFSFDSFDRMDSLVQAENLGDSTIDILNELDKEMEADLLLRPCHSL
jgi:hypothetical protein